jgi:'Cold-shock' DNA-binding domain
MRRGGGWVKYVFVHISAVEKAGLSTLNEGQTVEYEKVPNKGKTYAENLKLVWLTNSGPTQYLYNRKPVWSRQRTCGLRPITLVIGTKTSDPSL